MSFLTDFISELKLRNVRKTMTIYFSSALTTIGVIKLFIEVYKLSNTFIHTFFPILVTVVTCGLISAFVYAWFHGKEGPQRFQRKEVLLHALVLIVAVGFSYRIATTTDTETRRLIGKSIAVLPFTNMSDSKEDEYFSDGIMEDILTQLSKIGDLNVISRTSAMKYKNSSKTIREIADELGVATILEGSVRRSGTRVRIVGQLINAQQDLHLWAETYDREFKDIFAIQTEVAQKIADALKAQLSPDEEVLLKKEATKNLDAYAYYLRGRDYYYRVTKEDNERAIELFKKAIALDTAYALAFAGLADAYAQRYQRHGYDQRWADTSIALSEHAIALDPNIPEPYKSLGLAYYQREWYQRTTEQYRKALRLNPNYASVYGNMGELLDWTGHQDEAIPLIKKSMQLAPGRAISYQRLAYAYFNIEMDSIAIQLLTKAIELQPSLTGTYASLGDIYTAEGNFQKARLTLDSVLTQHPDDSQLLMSAGAVELFAHNYEEALKYYQRCVDAPEYSGLPTLLGFTLRKTGRVAESEKLLDQTVATNQKQIEALSEEGQRRYELARVFAIRKDTVTALRWLREAIERGTGNYRVTARDPLLENLHNNEEFKGLMAQIKKKTDAMRVRVQEHP